MAGDVIGDSIGKDRSLNEIKIHLRRENPKM